MAADPGLAAPSSEYQRLVKDASLGLLALADRLRQHWTAHAGAVGLTSAQAKLLLSLVPGEAVPMRELAGRLDYDASNLTSLADRLQARGAVTRRAAAGDRVMGDVMNEIPLADINIGHRHRQHMGTSTVLLQALQKSGCSIQSLLPQPAS